MTTVLVITISFIIRCNAIGKLAEAGRPSGGRFHAYIRGHQISDISKYVPNFVCTLKSVKLLRRMRLLVSVLVKSQAASQRWCLFLSARTRSGGPLFAQNNRHLSTFDRQSRHWNELWSTSLTPMVSASKAWFPKEQMRLIMEAKDRWYAPPSTTHLFQFIQYCFRLPHEIFRAGFTLESGSGARLLYSTEAMA